MPTSCSFSRTLSVFLLSAAALYAQPTAGNARRMALIIGNKDYQQSDSRLANSVNDAETMKAALASLGFTIHYAVNTPLRALDDAISRFVADVRPGDAVVFYYAGHGIQVQEQNYLLPIDFQAKTLVDAKYNAYPVSRILENLEARGAALQIVILDACRNNPFSRGWRGDSPTRGLLPMTAGRGTYIAFATAPGGVASDNPTGRNGLFTEELATALAEPGLSVDQIFNRVRGRVRQRSEGRQIPWSTTSIEGDFYFRAKVSSSSNTDSGPITTPPPPPPPRILTKVNPRDGLTYVWIAPGSFEMGCSQYDSNCKPDEQPPHQVKISRGFWLGQTEVTQAAFNKVNGKPAPSGEGNLPAAPLSFLDAENYCKAVGLALPTEAQWEYAARAGSPYPHYAYKPLQPRVTDGLTEIAWVEQPGPSPVAAKRPNAWGLHDMLGNVWEWVSDFYGEQYYRSRPPNDPTGPFPTHDGAHVYRGGSWEEQAFETRVSLRRSGSLTTNADPPPSRKPKNRREEFIDSIKVKPIPIGVRCAGSLP